MSGRCEEEVGGTAVRKGPSAEMRRFSAGIRVITALLCTIVLLTDGTKRSPWPTSVMVLYCGWAAYLLWNEAAGLSHAAGLWTYWVDVAWSTLVMKLFAASGTMMVVTLVHPVVLASIGFGVGCGALLAGAASLGLLYADYRDLAHLLTLGWLRVLPSALILALVPAAAFIARPMSVLRHRLALLDELEARLDPRRGL